MELKEAYLLAKNNTYKDFKEEIDYRITGQLRTNVSEHEFEVKLILPVVGISVPIITKQIFEVKDTGVKYVHKMTCEVIDGEIVMIDNGFVKVTEE